jgi:hypothetical protein
VQIPSVRIDYPNGGENLILNHNYTVKYTLKNVYLSDYIHLDLIDSSGEVIITPYKLINNDRTFELQLPSSLDPGAYKIKLRATVNNNHADIEDMTDNYFWVSSF